MLISQGLSQSSILLESIKTMKLLFVFVLVGCLCKISSRYLLVQIDQHSEVDKSGYRALKTNPDSKGNSCKWGIMA